MTPSLTIEEGLPPTGVFGDNKGSKHMHLQNKRTEFDNESLTRLKNHYNCFTGSENQYVNTSI